MLRQEGSVEAPFNSTLPEAALPTLEIPLGSEYKKPQDECGVFGIWAPGQAVIKKTIIGLEGLQHRGHSGAGIAYVLEGVTMVDPNMPKPIMVHKGHGRVRKALPDIYRPDGDVRGFDIDTYNDLVGSPVAIGHTRYSTAESQEWNALQPIEAISHNGNVDNMPQVAARFGVDIAGIQSDSGMISRVLRAVGGRLGSMEAALHEVLPHLNGAYCLTIIDNNRLIAARDPWGYHPLTVGELTDGTGYVVASESVVLPEVGAKFMRDVAPGEIIVFDENGTSSSRIDRLEGPQGCAYEGIYTAREDGEVDGVGVRQWRYNLGYYLGKDQPIEADIVVPVPASAIPSAEGYADATGIPLVPILLKLKDIRTFQMRGGERSEAIAQKYGFDPERIELGRGKRWILEDDSMIKGHTMRELVRFAREVGGATEVHVRLSSAHYRKPCLMGMDTHNVDNLIAAYMTDEEIALEIGADSVAYNTPERVQQAADEARIRPVVGKAAGKLCVSCVTGRYPFEVPARLPQPVAVGMPVLRETVELARV